MKKLYIDANTLLEQSFELAKKIHSSDFKPTALLALWRGGTSIGIAIQEGLSFLGNQTKHFALRTSYYDNKRKNNVQIENFSIISEQLNTNDKLLVVDDVFDSRKTIHTLLEMFDTQKNNCPNEIRIATPYFKPGNNLTTTKPDFFLHATDQWIVFPHELHGLDKDEITQNKPSAKALFTE